MDFKCCKRYLFSPTAWQIISSMTSEEVEDTLPPTTWQTMTPERAKICAMSVGEFIRYVIMATSTSYGVFCLHYVLLKIVNKLHNDYIDLKNPTASTYYSVIIIVVLFTKARFSTQQPYLHFPHSWLVLWIFDINYFFPAEPSVTLLLAPHGIFFHVVKSSRPWISLSIKPRYVIL